MDRELKQYKLNKQKTLEKLNVYGCINGGGEYVVEYAPGNYIVFSPRNYRFIRLGGFIRDVKIDYEELLKTKINVLKQNEIIVNNLESFED